MSIIFHRFLEELCEVREWGPSVLFVNETDYAPRNITLATDPVGHMNIMPVQGLNVYSMLKHETLVLSLKAAQLIQVSNERTNCAKTFAYEDIIMILVFL